MKKLSCFFFLFFPLLFFSQDFSFYKIKNTVFGESAVSIHTTIAQTYQFRYPLYHIEPDSVHNDLLVTVRQRDEAGKIYTNKGFHLKLNSRDSVHTIIEQNKFDMVNAGDFLLLSNEKKSSLFNAQFGYEQFEFPSKIIFVHPGKKTGLTYHPKMSLEGETALSCVRLSDGGVIWSAPVSARQNWNNTLCVYDSLLLVTAGGLQLFNMRRGLVWNYPVTTSVKYYKPITLSSFHRPTYFNWFKPVITTEDEPLISNVCSGILRDSNRVYFAGKDKIICSDIYSKKIWESDLSSKPMSSSKLFLYGENILLLNLDVAAYKQELVQFGKTFAALYNKHSGEKIAEKDLSLVSNLADVAVIKNNIIFADHMYIIELDGNLKIETLMKLDERQRGRFMHFIDGDLYYIEKEGFYVPLNFINDNVVYFKTDHDKVFGLNREGIIEYEYHFTELFWLNAEVGKNTLISQKGKSLLLNRNNESIQKFNSGEKAWFFNNRLYFAEDASLHVVSLDSLK